MPYGLRNTAFWVESGVFLLRDFDIPVDSVPPLARDFGVPVDFEGPRTRDYGVPVDWVALPLLRDFRAPVEWTGLDPNTLSIVFDVRELLFVALQIQWTVVNAGLFKSLPITFSVLQPLPFLPITFSVIPDLPATFRTDIQRPFGSVEETP